MLYTTKYNSPLGEITLASDGKALTGLWLDGQKYYMQSVKESCKKKDELQIFEVSKKWLKDYFDGKAPKISGLPLNPQGSDFRKRVWQILCEIPYGEVTTYGAIAKKIAGETGKNMSAQAIGGAVGHNPISIIIPCHRVVGADGSLTGYAGGIDKKEFLLNLEGVKI